MQTSRAQPDLKINLVIAVQFIFGAWSEVSTSTVWNCFRKACFARGSSDLYEACEAPTDKVMPELWSAVNENAAGLYTWTTH